MDRANHHRPLNRLTEGVRDMREKLLENAMDALRMAARDEDATRFLPSRAIALAEAIHAAELRHDAAARIWLRCFVRSREDPEGFVPPAYINAVMAVRYMKEAIELEHS